MTGPRTDGAPTTTRGEGSLPSGLYWQSWTVPQPVGVVVLVHGVHEHGGRYRHVAERLARSGYASYAADHPGHGRSAGARGDIGSMAAAVAGIEETVQLAGRRHPDVPVFVYGHSLGGLVSVQYLTGSPDPRVRGAVLSAPALDTSAATPLQRRVGPALSRLLPRVGVVQLEAEAVSRDPEVVRAYRTDPLNHMGRLRARTGTEIMIAAAAAPERLRSLTMPLLVLHGSADRLMPTAASEVVRDAAGSAEVTLLVYEGLYHEPHNEPEQERVLDDVVAWLDAHRG
ncbi:alpha/beta fold hydrolase [Modestobacter sp. I12A-02628]|uniref:Monoacylglycerol lipase n=1 Tax=Goekera deserti TaxID=2497753 RepID=A0A7K3WI67_9ACTN|nr:alpha/beta hydrolase [Goekera deserti]MPQ96401.1 alpha/beta fold hydrolase [Goekera deserti]NDI47287.1 alpha/beta fold hydrolase [Goekera deserti]NEL56117.1 alpha/beta hydrolase [Goekera deserti]